MSGQRFLRNNRERAEFIRPAGLQQSNVSKRKRIISHFAFMHENK